uniref:Uncharacterized protein n=1 Tax=Melopsittacus undulatus TaxID=13146 RepID=A0A8V5GZS3_MELUD
MCDTLNLKFMAEVQTTKGLLKEHYFFLAQKIFNDYSASLEDFQSRNVSWAQFNKVTGRSSTSPRGASRVTGLIGGLIIGFISKQYVCKLLSTEPDGTFLLRFSDSEIGGVTIAYVIRGKDGVENIQPFSAKDLSIRSLGDRIRDLGQLRNLYPNTPKDQAFGSHYNSEQEGGRDGQCYGEVLSWLSSAPVPCCCPSQALPLWGSTKGVPPGLHHPPFLCPPPRPFMPNQYMTGETSQMLSGGPSPEPRDEEMLELAPLPLMGDPPLQSTQRW